jgi:hypothetical protein
MDDELGKILQEVVVAYLMVLREDIAEGLKVTQNRKTTQFGGGTLAV